MLLSYSIRENYYHFLIFSFISDLTKKELKTGVLPTLNLPEKSLPSRPSNERTTTSILKREAFQDAVSVIEVESVSSVCYQNIEDFKRRIGKCKLKGWDVIDCSIIHSGNH